MGLYGGLSMKEFTEKTKQGYPILSIVRLPQQNISIVFEQIDKTTGKSVGYGWGNFYNEDDGSWAHGHYGYNTVEHATLDMLMWKSAYPEGNKEHYTLVYVGFDEDGKVADIALEGHRTWKGAKEAMQNQIKDQTEVGNLVEESSALNCPYDITDIEFNGNTVDAGIKVTNPDTGAGTFVFIVTTEPVD